MGPRRGIALGAAGFGTRFTLFDPRPEAFYSSPPNSLNWIGRFGRRFAVRWRGVQFIDDEDPLVVLAIPLPCAEQNCLMAVGTFLVRLAARGAAAAAAAMLGIPADEARQWAARQTVWEPIALRRLSELTLADWRARLRIRGLEEETQKLSDHLATTYEEISLLHRLTHNLKISRSDEDLGRVAIQWLRRRFHRPSAWRSNCSRWPKKASR